MAPAGRDSQLHRDGCPEQVLPQAAPPQEHQGDAGDDVPEGRHQLERPTRLPEAAVYRQGDGIIRDFDIPVFTQDRGFIEQFLATDPEDSVRPRLEVDRRVLAPETEVRFLGTEPKKWKDCN
jgi:hypothetical protein